MTRAWRVIDDLQTDDGVLELRQRGPDDFHLCLSGRILMNSRAGRSEEALGREVVRAVAATDEPSVLIAGLGMGLTLRAALAALPRGASVLVAELEPRVVTWCHGPLRGVCGAALDDARVTVAECDVRDVIGDADALFDAIALDLYEGVRITSGDPDADPFYGGEALARAHRALRQGGVFGRWCEQQDPGFERRLVRAGFSFERHRPGRGGRRHCVYCARRG